MVLAAQLFSASATADFFGSWIVSVSLPVAAAVFFDQSQETGGKSLRRQ
jgi:hypothetical protein